MEKIKSVKGKYGQIVIYDAIHALVKESELIEEGLAPKYDLCITDPPYNLNFRGLGNGKLEKEYYDDVMKPEKYKKWCYEWFDLLKMVCKSIVFTCGYSNRQIWFEKEEFEMVIWINMSRQGASKISHLNKFEPVLCWGKFDNKFITSVFQYNYGFNSKQDFRTIHPCPKPVALYDWIIESLKPLSVIDPFAGSGTVAEACEAHKIRYLGIEKNPVYIPDMEEHIVRGINKGNQLRRVKKLLGDYN